MGTSFPPSHDAGWCEIACPPAEQCIYPGDGGAYSDGGGCTGLTTAAVCTAALQEDGCAEGYGGTPAATCSVAGGMHELTGCTGCTQRNEGHSVVKSWQRL